MAQTTLAPAAAPSSPLDAWFAARTVVGEARGALGHLLIRGVPENEEDEDEDEDEDEHDNSKYSQADVDNMRSIVITPNRAAQLTEMEKLILGDQYGDSMLMFNTSFSYEVFESIVAVTQAFSERGATWPEKFDKVFAYTKKLMSHDTWSHDYEIMDEGFVSSLSAMWQALLAQSDDVLDIDPEFTRPGVVELLRQFKELVELISDEVPFVLPR